MSLDPIDRLQSWYKAQCDGDWEHSYGIKIDTLDNPGWILKIDLVGTDVFGRLFKTTEMSIDSEDWIVCKIENDQFVCTCGPGCLSRAIGIFTDWISEETQ